MEINYFRSFAETLLTKFQIRMWKKQKLPFLDYCKAEFAKLGYDDSEIAVHHNRNMFGFASRNLVVGKPDADILFTAHYDTPGNNGFLLFGSRLWGMTGTVVILPMFFVAIWLLRGQIAIPATIDFFIQIVLDILFIILLLTFFVQNKYNFNDNTSGVIGVFKMASIIGNDPELRQKCAFVLFDHEEVFLLGSRAFSKWRKKHHPEKTNSTVINFDCIGNGDLLNVMTKIKHEGWHKIADFLKTEGFNVIKTRNTLISANSDHSVFRKGISLSFWMRSLLGPIFIPRIHTKKDNICDINKIELLCSSVYKYINKLGNSCHCVSIREP